jgi:hypothetical protein
MRRVRFFVFNLQGCRPGVFSIAADSTISSVLLPLSMMVL